MVLKYRKISKYTKLTLLVNQRISFYLNKKILKFPYTSTTNVLKKIEVNYAIDITGAIQVKMIR